MGLFGKLLLGVSTLFPPSSVANSNSAETAFQLPENLKALGIEHIAIGGKDAFAEWKRIKTEGRKSPVIIGDDRDFKQFIEHFSHASASDTPAAILKRAGGLTHPESLRTKKADEEREAAEWLAKQSKISDDMLPSIQIIGPDGGARQLSSDEVRERLDAEEQMSEPEVGEWPEEPDSGPGLTVVFDNDGNLKPRVHILLLPTLDDTEIPAYLSWGGWNECPLPEYHVAALRSWKSRYGVALVAVNSDTMNLLVVRRPQDRDAALALAREQFLYCEDIVLQGTETLAPLAASLMNSDWWFFWWD